MVWFSGPGKREDPPVKWLAVLAAATALAGAQQPKVADVVARVDRYLSDYGSHLENIVAEETYRQRAMAGPGLRLIRVLRSDYALTYVSQAWVGYRDTFAVDGQPVRDRDERLKRLLASGAVAQAERIDRQNAQYNLANDRLKRTVNVPTLALEVLQPRYRRRFSVRRITGSAAPDRPGWILEFRERARPTIARTEDGHNQASRIEAIVDPATGEIHRTTMSWERTKGSIVVDYGRVDGVPVPVPLKMVERFTIGPGDEIDSEAIYTNYRIFQTSGRLVGP